MPKAAYRSGCRDKQNRLQWDSNLGLLTPQSDALTIASSSELLSWMSVSQGLCRANLHLPVMWPATDHEPRCRHVPINTIWRWTESTQRSGWWHSHTGGIYSDCSTREIMINGCLCTGPPVLPPKLDRITSLSPLPGSASSKLPRCENFAVVIVAAIYLVIYTSIWLYA